MALRVQKLMVPHFFAICPIRFKFVCIKEMHNNYLEGV